MLDARLAAIVVGEPDPLAEYWEREGLGDRPSHLELPSGPLERGELATALRQLDDSVEVRCGAYRVERQRTSTEKLERKAAVKAILDLVKLSPKGATFVAELAGQFSAAPPWWRVEVSWPGARYSLRLPFGFALVETSTSTAQACA